MALLLAGVLSGENQYNCAEFIKSASDSHHLEKDNAPFSFVFSLLKIWGTFSPSGE